MHVYIYDAFLNQKRFDSILSKIEIRITDLGLNGKIARLGVMKNVREAIESEIKRGAKTITAVGNDHLICEAINVMAGKNLPFGIIPINDGPNSIAKLFGIPFGEKACDILSARRIEKLDLLSINNFRFVSEASISADGTTIEISDGYSVEASAEDRVDIINLPLSKNSLPENICPDPQDGLFDVIIRAKQAGGLLKKSKMAGESFFTLTALSLNNSKKHRLLVSGIKEIETPAQVTLLEKGLNAIVGKDRLF